jgi:hypothetical protein
MNLDGGLGVRICVDDCDNAAHGEDRPARYSLRSRSCQLKGSAQKEFAKRYSSNGPEIRTGCFPQVKFGSLTFIL